MALCGEKFVENGLQPVIPVMAGGWTAWGSQRTEGGKTGGVDPLTVAEAFREEAPPIYKYSDLHSEHQQSER